VTDAVKSKAVVLYTSSGRLPMPHADPEAVRRMPIPDQTQLVATSRTWSPRCSRRFRSPYVMIWLPGRRGA
jgi:hypothetical protein